MIKTLKTLLSDSNLSLTNKGVIKAYLLEVEKASTGSTLIDWHGKKYDLTTLLRNNELHKLFGTNLSSSERTLVPVDPREYLALLQAINTLSPNKIIQDSVSKTLWEVECGFSNETVFKRDMDKFIYKFKTLNNLFKYSIAIDTELQKLFSPGEAPFSRFFNPFGCDKYSAVNINSIKDFHNFSRFIHRINTPVNMDDAAVANNFKLTPQFLQDFRTLISRGNINPQILMDKKASEYVGFSSFKNLQPMKAIIDSEISNTIKTNTRPFSQKIEKLVELNDLRKVFFGVGSDTSVFEAFLKEKSTSNTATLVEALSKFLHKSGRTGSGKIYAQLSQFLARSLLNRQDITSSQVEYVKKLYKQHFPKESNVDKLVRSVKDGNIEYAVVRFWQKKVSPLLKVFKGDLENISKRKNESLTFPSGIEFSELYSSKELIGGLFLANSRDIYAAFTMNQKSAPPNHGKLVSEFTGPYIESGAGRVDSLTMQSGEIFNLFPDQTSGIVIFGEKGSLRIFNKRNIEISENKYNLDKEQDLISFVKLAQQKKMSIFQSHLLINNYTGAVLKETSYENANRRVLFETRDGKIGVLNVNSLSLNETIQLLMGLNLDIKMAVNLDTGYRDFHTLHGSNNKSVSLVGYALANEAKMGSIQLYLKE